MTNHEEGSGRGGSATPTLWISIAAVCALAAIGLGIWGASKSSQLDKANKKVEDRDAEIASIQRSAARTKAADIRVEARDEARYRSARGALISADRQNADFKAEVARETRELDQARQELAAARTADEKRAAEAKVASERSDVAVACAQGAVDAIGEFTSKGGGAKTAMNKLEGFQSQCQAVLNAPQ